jgi:hypothetical protein
MVVKFGLRTTQLKKEQHFILAYQNLVTSENNNNGSITARIISSEYANDLSGRDSSIYTERRKKDFG